MRSVAATQKNQEEKGMKSLTISITLPESTQVVLLPLFLLNLSAQARAKLSL